ncbi:hypothetical protein CLV51_102408 [Chitinophaga niastensis]|uniref:Uncharacterized protein n=1 Tax=Chitinophaga niastensis TaxID=536980 RepID=A0A2P8HMW2_CHINA|nr:hypothetical protein [Chitinophaga niastensis]PSL47551.1 hypothetical protein CLV51_102408 [Chitinophaga niastensis]
MKSIFNAKTAIVVCLAVTVVTLSSFTHSSKTGLLGKGKVIHANMLQAAIPGTDAANALTPYPTTLIVRPTIYIIRFTALRTAILDYPTADIIYTPVPISGPGLLDAQQQIDSKMSRLD